MNTPLYGFHVAPGAIVQNSADDPDVRAENRCRDVGDVHFCAAGRMSLGYEGASDTNGTGVAILFMTRRGGDVGLSIALTPKAMRSLADTMQRMASDIEAAATKAAGDALDAASAALNRGAGK